MGTNSKEYMAAWRAKNRKKMYAYHKKWRSKNWEKVLAYDREYRKRPERLAAMRQYKKKPEVLAKLLARNAVYQAVKVGKLRPPKRCTECRKIKPLQGHHHRGYAVKDRLNVVWLCHTCHKIADQ